MCLLRTVANETPPKQFFELLKAVMRCNLSTITDISSFLWNRHGRDLVCLFTPRPFLTSAVFLTLHNALLTARGRRGFIVFLLSCFVMSSNVGDAM